ncbi:formin-J-like [Leptopilina boulardi]|uniref:formin-J-like n=1 Tax=Leptopilina boulardi TaxID=63433 RepID=UPI0021F5B62B|nr:formin-J-like [Leptopilina boulardi]
MMTSLVLLVPIVVSMTVAEILDDRLISRSKDTFTVSPEVELDSKIDSKRTLRRQVRINNETKTSQFSLPIGILENLSTTTPRILTTRGFKTAVKTLHNKSQTDVSESQIKSENNFSTLEKDVKKSQSNAEKDVDNLQIGKLGNTQNVKSPAPSMTRNLQRNVKNTQRNVKTVQNVKNTQRNVKNVQNVKNRQRNVKNVQSNIKTTPNTIKIVQNNIPSVQNIVKTSNNVKIITQSNVKNVPKNTTTIENSQTNVKQSDNNKSETVKKIIYPISQTNEKSISNVKSSVSENIPSSATEVKSNKLPGKRNRKNKGFFFSYPYVPQIRHHYPNYDSSNFEDCNYGQEEQRTPGGKKKYQDSNIYYIKLPPTPYMFVPGLGYVSQPPRYSPPPPPPPPPPSMTHVRPYRPARPPTIYQPHVNPFIKVPIDFISNGKPTSVYQWQDTGKHPSRTDNQITNLDKGPYVFNGRPSSIYLLRPDGSQTIPQPIRLNDYQNNGYYSSGTFD